ncbi:MAG: tetratricopeptide repeat protein [Bacteroidetes bacterium]|nr:tetratricopeptide repeat protein [Bacteroidota bacterium]
MDQPAATNDIQISGFRKHIDIIIPAFFGLIALIVFSVTFSADILNYDDQVFVTENQYVHGLSVGNLEWIFSLQSGAANGHYHPITYLVYALVYEIDGLNPLLFHLVNLLLHLLNIFLVYKLVLYLSRNCRKQAVVVALFFAIHPMHVEPVCWVSGLNGVLYTTFFLSAAISYIRYLDSRSFRFLLYVGLFFLLSLFSKSMAVTLPLVLLLFDWYRKRKFSVRLLIEKIPFFAVSVVFGLIAINSSKLLGTFISLAKYDYSIVDRFFMVSYSVGFYLLKAIIPFNLSVTIFNPVVKDGWLPMAYYIAPILLAILVIAVLTFKKHRHEISMGLLFFLLTISVAIQFVPIGNVLGAERYTYLPNIGVFFVIGYFFAFFTNKEKYPSGMIKPFYIIALSGLLVYNTLTSFNRSKIWKSTFDVYTEMIEKNPRRALMGYKGRGATYYKMGMFKEALADFNAAIQLRPDEVELYKHRGIIRTNLGDFQGAILDFNLYMMVDSVCKEAYYYRGLAYTGLSEYKIAISDFSRTIALDPENAAVYSNRGFAFIKDGQTENAMLDFRSSVELSPGSALSWFYLGQTKAALPQFSVDEVIADYEKAIALKLDTFFLYYNLGNMYGLKKDYEMTEKYLRMAVENKPDYIEAWNNLGIQYFYHQNLDQAEECFVNCLKINSKFDDARNNLGNVYLYQKKNDEACAEWQIAAENGNTPAKENIDKHCKQNTP